MTGTKNNKQLFEEKGTEIFSQDASELLKNLCEMDATVPGRTHGRRSHHRERYCIVRYLSGLATGSHLVFPLRVVKWESPDFFLYSSHLSIGLEVTEAGTEKSQRAATQLERSPLGTVLEGEAGLRARGQPLQGGGYAEPVQELSRLVLERLKEKTITLNEPHFELAGRYDLLVYDNTGSLGVLAGLADLAPVLKNCLMSWQAHTQAKRKFSTVSVLRDSRLLYDCTGEPVVLSVSVAS